MQALRKQVTVFTLKCRNFDVSTSDRRLAREAAEVLRLAKEIDPTYKDVAKELAGLKKD